MSETAVSETPEQPSIPEPLDILDALANAWGQLRAAPAAFCGGGLITAGLGVLTLGVLFPPLLVGLIRMADRHRSGQPIEARQVFEGLDRFGPAVITFALWTACVVLASVALVLPGLILAVLFSYSLHFVALRDINGIPALKESWSLCRDNISSVLLVLVTATGLNFVGGLVAVGVVVSGPLSLLLITHSFNALRKED